MYDPAQMPPPGVMEQLMGGGGMPPEMGMAGPPPGMAPGGPPPGAAPPELSPTDHLRQAIEHAQAALQLEPDDADSQLLAKVVQGLYQILAQRQKEEAQVMGNPATQRVVGRAMGGP